MSGEVVLSTQDLSKRYKIYDAPFDRVREALSPFDRNYHKDFFAVRGVTLELKRGEALGIIGRNGHGKSTFLKMVAGLLTPSGGSVQTSGKVAAILELTSNLRPELTGMENIRFNLKISGCTNRLEVESKTQAIVDFSELGDFIFQPVRTYSSGMKSRLGFGIATSLDHDILILDEVLAVGDFEFQQKCLSRINEMRDKISVIFVSHSMNSVRLFCDRAVVFEHGRVAFSGETDAAISNYLNTVKKVEVKPLPDGDSIDSSRYGDKFFNQQKIQNVSVKWDKSSYHLHEDMILHFSFDLLVKPKKLIIGVPIWDKSGNMVTSLNTDFYNINIDSEAGRVTGELKVSCVFNPSTYVSVFCVNDKGEFLYRNQVESFSVIERERVFGAVTPDVDWVIDA